MLLIRAQHEVKIPITNCPIQSVRIRLIVTYPLITCIVGSAVGFKLDSLLKLSDTRARNNKMTLMHYLCKVEFCLFPFLSLLFNCVNSC